MSARPFRSARLALMLALAACAANEEADAPPLVPCARTVDEAYVGHESFDAGPSPAVASAAPESSSPPSSSGSTPPPNEAATSRIPTPKPHARMAWTAKARTTVIDPHCGSRDTPCPLQLWMRLNMGPALAAKDPVALAAALEKTAALSPDPSWQWAQIAKNAAAAARKGDVPGARTSCTECHGAYKADFKAKYRLRPVN